jgi:hypothetical protein
MDSGRPAVLGAARPITAGLTPALEGARTWLLSYGELLPLMGLALALTLAYLLTAPVFGLPFDDSYISLLFARNLANHGFLTFDGESASAGATSLLHVAILALPIKLGAEPVKASVATGVVLHLALVPAVYWLARVIFRDRLASALAGASVAVMGYLAFDALNGMETTLFLLVSTLAAAAFLSARDDRRLLLAGALGALAVLSRPEGVLLIGAMALYDLLDPAREEPLVSPGTARRLALLGAPGAAALLGLALFYWATTGSFTPGTATAKLLFFREFELPLQTKFEMANGGVGNFIAPVLPWLALAAFGARRREALLFALFWAAFIVMYFALFPGGLTHYWYRYQHVFLPPIAVFAAGGLVSLARGRAFRTADLLATGLVGVVLVGAVAFQYESFRDNYAEDMELSQGRQVAMARYLNELVAPGESVATHDIGAIGYYTEREVIDLVGLVNPDVIEYHDGRRLWAYVDQARPDYLVAFPSWDRFFLHLGIEDAPQLFEEVRVFPGGVEPFVVYRVHY